MIAGLTKQDLCDALLPVLQKTRNLYDLQSLEYEKIDDGLEVVKATFPGGTEVINVSMDSGTAMIKDIIKQLGY